MKKAGIEDIP